MFDEFLSLITNSCIGVFGIPLEVLVERNGADSMHGAGAGSLRIPSFVDDVISAMKQMGELRGRHSSVDGS